MTQPDPPDELLARGRKHGVRRRVILREAARLFGERGYSAVGMNDIGAAAGVTGSAVYRHFASKQALLLALIDASYARLTEAFNEVTGDVPRTPSELLEGMVDAYLTVALANRNLTVLVEREAVALPEHDYRRFRRERRRLREEWVGVLLEARPDWDETSARIAVIAAMGMVNAVVGSRTGLDDAELRARLRGHLLTLLMGIDVKS